MLLLFVCFFFVSSCFCFYCCYFCYVSFIDSEVNLFVPPYIVSFSNCMSSSPISYRLVDEHIMIFFNVYFISNKYLSQDLVASQRPFSKDQWRGREREARQRKRWTDRGMDGKTICRDTGTGTQPQQMEETAAQLVRTASRRLHGELKERGNARIPKMSDGPFLSGIPGAVISYLFSYLLCGIPGLSFHTLFLSPVWNPGAVISYPFPISCVESRGCHFIPFSCLLSGFSA